ncbi:MAG: tRNA uridine-5-carboxymethylaminomethyl(34) synthesis enzyme MnmG [Deltaproteobacteria bacterium]|nr:tRNA uridine-5-carboxymethylaminomethyl(34) synthesis enzyme MnmG [Deltaproteobacteria bacterium]
MQSFDVIVAGAGHAGCEAAALAARLGRRVLLVTLRADAIARLSCNPAIGGLGKGHLVREVDALGGLMARVADRCTLQFRVLNTRKGLAVRSSRAQVDIHRYPREMAAALASQPGLVLVQGEVTGLDLVGGRVAGVTLACGTRVAAPVVILTTGTFLEAVMHCGDARTRGGRIGDPPSHGLSASLSALGLRLGRLKTGTTPRLDGRTVDWSRLVRQTDVEENGRFSFTPSDVHLPRRDCYLAATNERVHGIIRAALPRAPLFTGAIAGRGPRYCPSIEDKVVRFPERTSHHLFLEPESIEDDRIYVNGLSTSLPPDVQDAMVAAVPGLEHARIVQYGYAVEYDFTDPRDLGPGLEHRAVPGLFFAGQVNGTSGYEEAAAQGLVAGVSAALGEPLVLARHEAYIGVLVDDLIHRGVGGEPYRMFTSRAEFRLTLREDNADLRLTPRGRALGLVDDAAWARFEARRDAIERTRERVAAVRIDPGTLSTLGFSPGPGTTLEALLRRPGTPWAIAARAAPDLSDVPLDVAEQVLTALRYAGYIARDARRAEEATRLARTRLPADLLDADVPGLSTEVRERLRAIRPATLGEAANLPGITPAAVHLLAVHLSRRDGRPVACR